MEEKHSSVIDKDVDYQAVAGAVVEQRLCGVIEGEVLVQRQHFHSKICRQAGGCLYYLLLLIADYQQVASGFCEDLRIHQSHPGACACDESHDWPSLLEFQLCYFSIKIHYFSHLHFFSRSSTSF